jgi:K+-transporting ATPase ATPase C chain
MLDVLVPALRASLFLWALLGLVYPLAVTGLAQILFPDEANGSLIRDADGTVIGSRLIGQQWTGPEWFHGRPSATTGSDPNDPTKTIAVPYNAANSGGSNLGPTSGILVERLTADRKALDQTEPELAGKSVPADMLTTSGSGLDPHVKPGLRRTASSAGGSGTRRPGGACRCGVGPAYYRAHFRHIRRTPGQRIAAELRPTARVPCYAIGSLNAEILAVSAIGYRQPSRREPLPNCAGLRDDAAS